MDNKHLAYINAEAEVQGHIHAGLRSAPTSKSYHRWYWRRLGELQDNRDVARAEWEKVKPPEPSRAERLISSANGHPDLASTHAARRLCEKRGINWRVDT